MCLWMCCAVWLSRAPRAGIRTSGKKSGLGEVAMASPRTTALGAVARFLALIAVACQSVPPTPLHEASDRGDVQEVRNLLAQTPASVGRVLQEDDPRHNVSARTLGMRVDPSGTGRCVPRAV